MKIGSKIKVLRLLSGKMQQDLAYLLGMKASTHVNRWEKNIMSPKTNMLQQLGDALSINWPWLQDSSFVFSNSNEIYYRPLTPYSVFSPRWLALLPLELTELLPDFWRELKVERTWAFHAPCGGGVAVVKTDGPTIVIICRPEIAESVLNSLPLPTRIDISDSVFSSVLLRSVRLEDLFKLCGITMEVPPPEAKTTPSSYAVTISVKAEASLLIDQNKLYQTITASVQEIIMGAELENAEIEIKVTPPLSLKEIVLKNLDPVLIKLAELAWPE
jgi:transcriptional regulator with XRE-family HTH domain